MTKFDPIAMKILDRVLSTRRWTLVYDEDFMSARNRIKKGIPTGLDEGVDPMANRAYDTCQADTTLEALD
eukprot:7007261-Alexandrium_andersonii.AAC.1